MKPKVPKRLYHYCGLSALRGIIQGKFLRMTNVYWMDDTTELLWFYRVVQDRLRKSEDANHRQLLEEFERFERNPQPSVVFCSCFSEVSDSRSQWLEYADQGRGFAIGFDPATFECKRRAPRRPIELSSVIYDEVEQRRLADSLIRQLTASADPLEQKLQRAFTGINVWWQAASCKNPNFSAEKEWRLIQRDDPKGDLDFFERSGGHLIPFAKFQLDWSRNPIREIWFGPRNKSAGDVTAIGLFLKAHNINPNSIELHFSEVPLRPEF